MSTDLPTGDDGLLRDTGELFELQTPPMFIPEPPLVRRAPPEPPEPPDDGERRLSSLHVLQRLRLLSARELVDPYMAELFPEREFLAASAYFGVEMEAAQAVRSGARSYARVIADGVWARFRLYSLNFDIVEEYVPLRTQDPVPVGELHCPNVPGSECTFTSGQTKGRKVGLQIFARGVGGGGWSEETKFHRESRITIGPGHCAVLLAVLSGDYSVWRSLDDPRRVEVLVNVTGIGELYDEPLELSADYDPEAHLCTRDDGYALLAADVERGWLRIGHDYDWFAPRSTEASPKPHVHVASWTREREYHRKWGLSIDGGPAGELTGGGEVTARFVHEVQVEVHCPKNRDYIGRYRSARELPQQWGASPPFQPGAGRRPRR